MLPWLLCLDVRLDGLDLFWSYGLMTYVVSGLVHPRVHTTRFNCVLA